MDKPTGPLRRAVTHLLDERANRHTWLIPLTLLTLGISLIAAGLGTEWWWIPAAVPLTARPTQPRR